MKLMRFGFILLATALFAFGCGGAAETENNTASDKPTESASPETPSASPAESPKENAETNDSPKSDLKPDDVDADKPIPVAELKAAFLQDEKAWIGKEVSVVGKYAKTTTSSLPGGDVIRIDISDAKTNQRAVGCEVKATPPDDLAKNREDRVFKGTVKENKFGNPLLEPCELVK